MTRRVHTVHFTGEATRWMTQRYGMDETCEIVKGIVRDAGLDPMNSDWMAISGQGVTVRGWVTQQPTEQQ